MDPKDAEMTVMDPNRIKMTCMDPKIENDLDRPYPAVAVKLIKGYENDVKCFATTQ
jgi:hypothetical protein